ncbi:TolC family protein [Sinimarinibacterium sp. NLF-5-8]|uniref:TolC family protein n=1 Tax=Sinimarinibacterium sp. NLF-5-8 TaxID=2698684 RepID=UPI00137BDCB3|nr:TolC family protein [Sinimarinibacterium sp. NLF-5-8]
MLFAGGRIHYRVAQMAHTEKVRYLELLEEAQLKALETTQAYLDVQRYRQTVALAEQNLRDHQAVHQHIEQRVSSGVANRADLMQISGRVSLAQANLMTELANL